MRPSGERLNPSGSDRDGVSRTRSGRLRRAGRCDREAAQDGADRQRRQLRKPAPQNRDGGDRGVGLRLQGSLELESRVADRAQSTLRILLEAAPEHTCQADGGRSAGSAFQSTSSLSTAASVIDTSSPWNARLPVSIS